MLRIPLARLLRQSIKKGVNHFFVELAFSGYSNPMFCNLHQQQMVYVATGLGKTKLMTEVWRVSAFCAAQWPPVRLQWSPSVAKCVSSISAISSQSVHAVSSSVRHPIISLPSSIACSWLSVTDTDFSLHTVL